MCGIVGYLGEDPAGPIVYKGLQNLEYRGYDSAGVALVGEELTVQKRSGEVGALSVPEVPSAVCGIGHTRWSTHGPPTDENAHPHTGLTGEVAVVHNGIIENYEALRESLSDRTFTSQTDTEVIPHLLEIELENGHDLYTALSRVVSQLEGSFAICAVHAGRNEIVATRNQSPLVLGHAKDGVFLGSDVTAFLEHTRDVTYLEDGDIAVLRPGDVHVYRDGTEIAYPIETVEWEADAAEKGGYEHFMRKEIHEQPASLRQTLSGRIDLDRGAVELDLEFPKGYLSSVEEIQFVACGTSYYASLYAARLFEEIADIRATVSIASEYTFDGGRDPWRTLTIAVTQSGETADTLGAIRRAKRAGAQTLAVTNMLGSSVSREVKNSVFIRAGPEIGVAATKTFASQVTTLALLAVYLGRERGVLSPSDARSILEDLRGLPGGIQQVLDKEASVKEAAVAYQDSDAFFFVGRRHGYPVALEGALKLKEISYDHAEGFAAGELKHGPLALVTDNTPVLAVLTDGGNIPNTVNNLVEAQTRGAPAIGAISESHEIDSLDVGFEVPDAGLFEPLIANVYFQLFAYHVANEKGRPIDKPRNLAKSVTVG